MFGIEQVGEELRYQWDDLPNPMHPVGHTRIYRLHRPFRSTSARSAPTASARRC